MTEKFNLVLHNRVAEGHNLAEVQQRLAQRTKLPLATVQRLYQQPTAVVKKQVDATTAEHYCRALRACGAVVEMQPVVEPAEAVAPAAVAADEPVTEAGPLQPQTEASYPASQPRKRNWLLPAVVAALVLIAGVAAAGWYYLQQQALQSQQQVRQALVFVRDIQQQVETFVAQADYVPISNAEAGLELQYPASVAALTLQEGACLQLRLSLLDDSGENYTLYFSPDVHQQPLHWYCHGGTLPAELRPADCPQQRPEFPLQNTAFKARQYQTVTIAGQVLSLSIPADWQVGLELNDAALFAAGNPDQEVYHLLLREPLADFPHELNLQDYAVLAKNQLQQQLQQVQEVGVNPIAVEGFTSLHYQFTAMDHQVPLHYQLLVLTDNQYYYQMLNWTLAGRFARYQQDFTHLLQSLKKRPATQAEKE